MKNKKVIVGGVLSMDNGRHYGFKIRFDDIEDAMIAKNCVIGFFEGKGFSVKSEKGYHE